MHTGKTYLEAVQELFKEAKIQYSFGEKGVRTKYQYRYPKAEQENNKENVYRYLGQRGISKTTIDLLDVREDSHGNRMELARLLLVLDFLFIIWYNTLNKEEINEKVFSSFIKYTFSIYSKIFNCMIIAIKTTIEVVNIIKNRLVVNSC